MFHLIRAGVAGGKTVPETVAEHPLVFATLTAPSFGTVHTSGRYHPGHPARRCPHGRPLSCGVIHAEGLEGPRSAGLLGQPLCADCYDYPSHIVWQWFAPDLWRRFTIAKVAEFQRRSAVHFHALLRLDGPRTSNGAARAPGSMTAEDLAQLVADAAHSVRPLVPPVDDDDTSRRLAFGAQFDARVVRGNRLGLSDGDPLTGEQLAGCLAKYATKSAADDMPDSTAHRRRLQATIANLDHRGRVATLTSGRLSPFALLGRWSPMLGFRGHFVTKSRRYSVTLGQLRRARQRAQTRIAAHRFSGRPLDLHALVVDLLADAEDASTLVVSRWQYLGSGWANDGERALATAAAAHAREYAQERAQLRRNTPTRPCESQADEKD